MCSSDLGVLATVLPELSSFLDDDPDGNTRLWKRLAVIDARVAEGDPPSDATLLTALLLEPALEALEGERDLTGATTAFFEPMQERLAFPRRLFDRIRQVMAVQRRIAAGRHLPLLQRDFYRESADLWTLDALARGVDRAAIQRTLEGRDGPRSGARANAR